MMNELRDALQHEFADPDLIKKALTHRSATSDDGFSYERLEFLGDRILALIVADLLLAAFPEEDEGALARRHAALVRKETLAEVARAIDLGPHIVLGTGEDESGGRENDAILSDVCEAVIAALYREGGVELARVFIERHWSPRLEQYEHPPRDAKTTLQEWAQGLGLPFPNYEVAARTGPDHAPVFTISVSVEGHDSAEGMGASKRAAEQEAAARLLSRVTADA